MTTDSFLVPVRVEECGRFPCRTTREAHAEERAAIASRLGISELGKLHLEAEITPSGDSGFRVRAKIEARMRRVCVVTLERFDQELQAEFDLEFRSGADVGSAGGEEEPEPILEGALHIGSVAVEVLGVELDPYPRHPDAPPPGAADWIESCAEPETPFARALGPVRTRT